MKRAAALVILVALLAGCGTSASDQLWKSRFISQARDLKLIARDIAGAIRGAKTKTNKAFQSEFGNLANHWRSVEYGIDSPVPRPPQSAASDFAALKSKLARVHFDFHSIRGAAKAGNVSAARSDLRTLSKDLSSTQRLFQAVERDVRG